MSKDLNLLLLLFDKSLQIIHLFSTIIIVVYSRISYFSLFKVFFLIFKIHILKTQKKSRNAFNSISTLSFIIFSLAQSYRNAHHRVCKQRLLNHSPRFQIRRNYVLTYPFEELLLQNPLALM